MHARQIGPLNLGAKPYVRKKSQIVFVGAGYRVLHAATDSDQRPVKELDESAGRDALRTATLNALSAAKAHIGSLDRVTRVVSVKVYLATHGDFYNQPIVADAASELPRDVFGEDKEVRAVRIGIGCLASRRTGHGRVNVRSQ